MVDLGRWSINSGSTVFGQLRQAVTVRSKLSKNVLRQWPAPIEESTFAHTNQCASSFSREVMSSLRESVLTIVMRSCAAKSLKLEKCPVLIGAEVGTIHAKALSNRRPSPCRRVIPSPLLSLIWLSLIQTLTSPLIPICTTPDRASQEEFANPSGRQIKGRGSKHPRYTLIQTRWQSQNGMWSESENDVTPHTRCSDAPSVCTSVHFTSQSKPQASTKSPFISSCSQAKRVVVQRVLVQNDRQQWLPCKLVRELMSTISSQAPTLLCYPLTSAKLLDYSLPVFLHLSVPVDRV